MKELIETFLDKVQITFDHLTKMGYTLSSETVNPKIIDAIWLRVNYNNINIKRSLTIDFFPRANYKVNVIITKTGQVNNSFSLSSFNQFVRTNSPVKFSSAYEIDKNNFEKDLQRVLNEIKDIITTDLKFVISGTEWIEIPMIDPREPYL